MNRHLEILKQLASCWPILALFYFLSYAPYLRLTSPDDPQYGSHLGYLAPRFYDPIEWCIVNSPADFVLLQWAELWGVRSSTEIQAFYFAQGATEPWEFSLMMND